MKKNLYQALNAFIKSAFLKLRVPLAIGWALTYRCNQKCLYCGVWKSYYPELSTDEVIKKIDEFKKLGTMYISFTGGEPLLRDDLGEIIRYVRNKNIYISISSNGSLVSKRIDDLEGVNMVKLSLDGPANVHDAIRGEGSFMHVINALEQCKLSSIPVSLGCVLSKYNLDYLDFLIKVALDYKLQIYFQPASVNLLRINEVNPIAPPEKEYKIAIDKLIKSKKKGLPIGNSLSVLNYIYHYPNFKKINCFAGRLIFRIEPDAKVLACDRISSFAVKQNEEKENIVRQIARISNVKDCGYCWCSSMAEFNFLFSLDLGAINNFLLS